MATLITIFDAHTPDSIALTKRLLERSYSMTLYAEEITDELKVLAKNPLIQLRYSRSDIINNAPILL